MRHEDDYYDILDPRYPYDKRRRAEELKSFISEVKDLILKIEDVIFTEDKSGTVDLDAFIDILRDGEEETLQLFVLQRMRSEGKSEMKIEPLLIEMKQRIEGLLLSENIKNWWMSFRNAGTGAGRDAFEIKKIREYTELMEGINSLSKEEEQMFKNRNKWTSKELFNSCSEKGLNG